MLVLPGNSSLSVSKRKGILTAIQAICPSVESIDAIYIHLIKCCSAEAEAILLNRNSTHRKLLDALLEYGDDFCLPGTKDALETGQKNLVYVLPRPGSISPWSSKATDIAYICNLGKYIERIERGIAYVLITKDDKSLIDADLQTFSNLLHDRMTQVIQLAPPVEHICFSHRGKRPLRSIDLMSAKENSISLLATANKNLGLALTQDEMNYLLDAYVSGEHALNRNPTDAELFMFAQVNSEHCRHKIFNADWTIDGQLKDMSLFQMIRNTEKLNGTYSISAYSDNAAVFAGYSAPRFTASHSLTPQSRRTYEAHEEHMPILVKVETHNHPTAVSPYPGAATGSGGEIRDEGAVGRGSKPKAGLAGFTVSNLLIPGYEQPWEENFGYPSHVAPALDIMLEAPLGASAFNNEFGRPALTGYFRTFAERFPSSDPSKPEIRGFHKPIMIAGGLGNVRPQFAKKSTFAAGAKLVVLGGPGLLIGLGGGAASSLASGASSVELDFASVQRDNAEMQRRCQQVIDACVDMDNSNPIQSIHDVGAGGLSNALPELVHDSGLGAEIEIRDVLVADSSMSPMEIWCNESQERYVMAINPFQSKDFMDICARERCPFAFVGTATENEELIVTDRLLGLDVIRLKMSTLFGKPPRMLKKDFSESVLYSPFDATLSRYLLGNPSLEGRIHEAASRVLRLPTVGSKSFLITIGDRTITGLVARDQMVGPWQVPVADVAVTRSTYGFNVLTGEAMAMGERPPVALLNPAAASKLAVGESLTNIAAASIEDISRVKLSANWMCAASKSGEGAKLYEAVKAIGMDLCPALGIGIPVGKDSMSMSMQWSEGASYTNVTAPLSLNITAFAPVNDIRMTWTPQLVTGLGQETVLLLCDIALGKVRLGGSALAQVFRELGSEAPDVDAFALKAFFQGCQTLHKDHPDVVLAYHDRSDGGIFTTLVEMSFAGRVGIDISLDAIPGNTQPLAALFNEELGAVMQIRRSDLDAVVSAFVKNGFPSTSIHIIGSVHEDRSNQAVRILYDSTVAFTSARDELQSLWSETSYRMQSLRDEPDMAKQEFDLIKDATYNGIHYHLTYSYEALPSFFSRPKVAILREQGVNGHVEMAWAFTSAGFEAIDVHMSDIINGSVSLSEFRGIAACGGFSYGDVLGAGNGWAKSILFNETALEEFKAFFHRTDIFALAVCNGCQFFSHLKHIIPGAALWPDFKRNKGERFEARASMVEVVDSKVTLSSVFLRNMGGSRLPVAVAHGEGRASFDSEIQQSSLLDKSLVAIRYIDSFGNPTEAYPQNPNGSPCGITGVQTPDGRVLALMPHPERVVTLNSNSWFPNEMQRTWHGTGPWYRIFQNARQWCG